MQAMEEDSELGLPSREKEVGSSIGSFAEPQSNAESSNSPRATNPGTTYKSTDAGTLARIVTGRSVHSTWQDPGPPPDGGLNAWTQVAMAHLVIFNTWGYIAAFGVFQTYYLSTLNRSPSDIAWIGSMQIFLLSFIGTLSGRATDAGLFRPVYIVGLILQVLGIFMTSVSKTYWQLFLAQGVCTGIGNGLQFCPTMGLISTYFSKRRSTALGFVTSGAATGGIVYAVMVQQLLPKVGFGWTVRILGFVTLATGLIAMVFLRTRIPPRKSGPLVEWGAFKEAPYVLYCLGMFFNFWSLYFAFFFVGAFGRNVIGVSYADSINFILIMNGIGYVGRLLPNYFADRTFGPLNSIIPFAFIAGVMIFAWVGVHSRGSLIAFAALYGLFAAGMQSLFPAALTSLTTDIQKTGTRLGMGFTIVSFAALTGPAIAGALISEGGGSYVYAQIWAGCSFLLGGALMTAARIAKSGWKLRAKL